jgi:hypothetical protein
MRAPGGQKVSTGSISRDGPLVESVYQLTLSICGGVGAAGQRRGPFAEEGLSLAGRDDYGTIFPCGSIIFFLANSAGPVWP